MARRLVILGAPGAGKGTQAVRIASTYGIPHVSTGEILRHHIRNETELGREAHGYIEQGHLVPDALVLRLVEERLAYCDDVAPGFILDGFPRSLAQAEALDDLLEVRSEAVDLVVNLVVSDEELVERLTARLQCPRCGEIFNLKFHPPEGPHRCPAFGFEPVALVQREDDTEETVRERLRVYHATCDPILHYYEAQGKLRNIDGDGECPDAIFRKIEQLIGSKDEAWTR